MICKKAHLHSEAELEILRKIIDQELNIIQTHGDNNNSVILEGSEDETKEDDDKEEEMWVVIGFQTNIFRDETSEKKCMIYLEILNMV